MCPDAEGLTILVTGNAGAGALVPAPLQGRGGVGAHGARSAWLYLTLPGWLLLSPATAADQASVGLSYEVMREATLHEPIVMQVVLDNGSDRGVYVDFRHEVSFRFELVAPDGRASSLARFGKRTIP